MSSSGGAHHRAELGGGEKSRVVGQPEISSEPHDHRAGRAASLAGGPPLGRCCGGLRRGRGRGRGGWGSSRRGRQCLGNVGVNSRRSTLRRRSRARCRRRALPPARGGPCAGRARPLPPSCSVGWALPAGGPRHRRRGPRAGRSWSGLRPAYRPGAGLLWAEAAGRRAERGPGAAPALQPGHLRGGWPACGERERCVGGQPRGSSRR